MSQLCLLDEWEGVAMRRRFGLLFALAIALSLLVPAFALGDALGVDEEVSGNAVGPSSKTTVDPDTRSQWGSGMSDSSTRNVGGVWTDKTVCAAGEESSSDFLTTLSAVSSGLNGSCPTKVVGGDASHSGYITFADELGEFMQVDGFTEAIIGGVSYGPANKTVSGNVDTYTFPGKAADIVVTVERADADSPRQGDKVTVKVPASLIPTRAYTVDAVAGTFSVQDIDDVSPIRVTYASSVKDAARLNLFSPDDVVGLSDYIEANWDRSADTVAFYANKWRGNASGDATASFEPNDSSSYYFFQENTPIYIDEACTQRTTAKPEGDGTYYYKDTFVAKGTNGEPVEDHVVASFDGASILNLDNSLVSDSSGWLIKKGAMRFDRVGQMDTKKVENVTGTASSVLDSGLGAKGSDVQSHLGNNGKIEFSLATASAALDTGESLGLASEFEGRSWTDDDNFTFRIALKSGDPNGTDCQLRSTGVAKANLDEHGRAPIDFGNIVFSKASTYVYKVSEDQGTAGGITYSKNVATITIEVTVDAAGALHAAVKSVENPVFVNTYQATPVEVGFGGIKVLEGRDLKASEFEFELAGDDGTALIAANDERGTIDFDVLSFDSPGTYAYSITEVAGDEPDVTYDKEPCTATVEVTDNGKGQLVASVAYEKDGKQVDAARFVNSYKAPEVPKASESIDSADPENQNSASGDSSSEKHDTLAPTGDSALGALLAIAVLMLAAVACFVSCKRFRL